VRMRVEIIARRTEAPLLIHGGIAWDTNAFCRASAIRRIFVLGATRGATESQEFLLSMTSRRCQEAQAWLDNWETHRADTRIHGTTKQAAAMFF
jgi:hypothetical protein